MFTQLDLFGDLPAPEKPSNQPSRTEKKSSARSGGSASSVQPAQTQLSMGLPEPAFPDPSTAWTGNEQDPQSANVPELTPSTAAEQDTSSQPPSEAPDSSDPLAPLQSGPEDPVTPMDMTSTAGSETPQKSAYNSLVSAAEDVTETRAEKGRRYYIQTEIPADPPLAAKPPGPEAMFAGLVTTNNTSQEPRPRYIQTEIPSDPIEDPAGISETQTGTSVETPRSETDGSTSANPPSPVTASVPETPVISTGEKQKVPFQAIAPEALRRTRPLMPPKVILAEQEEDMPAPIPAKTQGSGQITKAETTNPATPQTPPSAPEAVDTNDLPATKTETEPVSLETQEASVPVQAASNPETALVSNTTMPETADSEEDAAPAEISSAEVTAPETPEIVEDAAPAEIPSAEDTAPETPEIVEVAARAEIPSAEDTAPETADSLEDAAPADAPSSTEKTTSRRKRTVREPVMEGAGPGIPPDDQLNARQYYSIGEVATMFGVKASLLRYWESEFEVLKLRKNRKGDRFFRPEDIRSLQLIHHLLRDKKYTIEGAREYMRNAGKMKEKFETIETLKRIRQFLVEMRNGLQVE